MSVVVRVHNNGLGEEASLKTLGLEEKYVFTLIITVQATKAWNIYKTWTELHDCTCTLGIKTASR